MSLPPLAPSPSTRKPVPISGALGSLNVSGLDLLLLFSLASPSLGLYCLVWASLINSFLVFLPLILSSLVFVPLGQFSVSCRSLWDIWGDLQEQVEF